MLYYSQDVANETGMTTEGLRYYEKKGLVRFDKDNKNGYRTYPIMQVPLLRMVKILNAYGVPLSQVAELIHSKEGEPAKLLNVLGKTSEEMEKQVWREQRLLERLKEHEAILQRVVERPKQIWFIRREEMCYLEYYGAKRLRRDRELQKELERWLSQMPLAYPMPVLHREDLDKEDTGRTVPLFDQHPKEEGAYPGQRSRRPSSAGCQRDEPATGRRYLLYVCSCRRAFAS